jgi:hypothetical protein
MADDKKKKPENWERRTLQSHGSHFRLDINNPQVTPGGEEVYTFFSSTDDGDKLAVGHDQSGKYKIHCDKTIEIVGGSKSSEQGVDVVISGRNGDVTITADKNGKVTIRGKNIMIQADEVFLDMPLLLLLHHSLVLLIVLLALLHPPHLLVAWLVMLLVVLLVPQPAV